MAVWPRYEQTALAPNLDYSIDVARVVLAPKMGAKIVLIKTAE